MPLSRSSIITPCLWFDHEGEEAAKFYTSIFPDSEIGQVSYYTEVSCARSFCVDDILHCVRCYLLVEAFCLYGWAWVPGQHVRDEARDSAMIGWDASGV